MMRCSCTPSSGWLATDDEQTLNNEAPPTMDRGCFVQMLLVVMMTVAGVLVLVGGLLDDRGFVRWCGITARWFRVGSRSSQGRRALADLVG
jgi:hypothetical protein